MIDFALPAAIEVAGWGWMRSEDQGNKRFKTSNAALDA